MPPDRALRDQQPLARTLARLVDFKRLNDTDLRLSIITIDMLPIARAFRESASHEFLCIAVDLYSLSHGRPSTLDQTVARVQDLAFASQSSSAIAALMRERELMRRLDPGGPSAILAHLAYRAPGHQRSLKPLDYSRASIGERIIQGQLDMTSMLARLAEAPRTEALAYLSPRE
jgi:NTE family protein